MTHGQWSSTIASKVQTSWNLHDLLPQPLDFFILLSSLSGVYGTPSQSNYAAGCTFQDALARHRVLQGQKAVSFDLGVVRNIGTIAENGMRHGQRHIAKDVGQIDDIDIMALLDTYCDPNFPLLSAEKSQVLIGVVTPKTFLAHAAEVPPILQVPLLSGFTQVEKGAGAHGKADAEDPAALFNQATEPEDRARVVVRALSK
jgi:hypothetical protein